MRPRSAELIAFVQRHLRAADHRHVGQREIMLGKNSPTPASGSTGSRRQRRRFPFPMGPGAAFSNLGTSVGSRGLKTEHIMNI